VTMGGGAGVSIHGSHRIVSERILFAMPETGIGLFPDIGASWFLSCCPGQLGMYLGLTGLRMHAADTLYAGIGDIYMESGRNEDLLDALASADSLDERSVNDLLRSFTSDPGAAPIAAYRDEIDRCFAGDSVEAILASLEDEDTDWARTQLKYLAHKSPTALKLTFRQLRLGPTIESIADIMKMEYRMAHRTYRGVELFEGIRAVVIDKDGAPQWQPDNLAAVSEDDLNEYFVPAPGEPDFSQAELS
jgi:enoyl-CoA hydratase